ncbi:MAG TPA: hypothetical protein VH120_07925, partial [Gemmataceae bacterium]|nr:hypothetical protein [Gemmataceae bacterium]
MAQYYTLDEAAQRLGLTTDAFRRKLATEWKQSPRRYPDGATLRFQAAEIDELARTTSQGSDADLRLADEPLKLVDDSSEDFVPLGGDEMVIHREPTSSGRLKKGGSDSDVRLDVAGGSVRPSAQDDASSAEIDLDAEQRAKPASSKRIKPSSTKITGGGDQPGGSGSDFDLSLGSDSSDEFELQLTDESEEVDIGVLPGGKGVKAGDSGINLQAPADSGISLEKSSDFELSLEGDGPKSTPKSGPRTPQRTGPLGGPKSGPKSGPKTGPKTDPNRGIAAGDESEFELTLDDSAADG